MKLLNLANGIDSHRKLLKTIIGFIVCIGSMQTSAMTEPYVSANRNPFIQVYGLPVAQSARLIKPGKTQWAVQLEAVSNFTVNDDSGESIFIDGESHRANMQFRYGITDNMELGIHLPYLSHEGGGLDSFIDDWHDFFSLPDGGRTEVANDQLQYVYQQENNTVINLNRSSDGVGDISINMAYQLSNSVTRQWALRAGVKLPTGDAGKLTGSESTDIALGLTRTDQSMLQQHNVVWHTSIGVLWMSGGEVIDKIREDWVAYGSSTVSWRYNNYVSLKAQVDFHSAFYDSALTELGKGSAQLILGGAVQLTDRWVLDLSVSEDIAVDTAPDVIFQLGLTLLKY